METEPDYTKNGPWSSTIYVQRVSDGKVMVRAEFIDHGNTFTANWINEKLLFIQVWWGRIASSDLILDVDQRRFIYNELANYAEMNESCHQK